MISFMRIANARTEMSSFLLNQSTGYFLGLAFTHKKVDTYLSFHINVANENCYPLKCLR